MHLAVEQETPVDLSQVSSRIAKYAAGVVREQVLKQLEAVKYLNNLLETMSC